MRRIAIISEHASPLAQIGSVDSGGQNVYVAQTARNFAAQGHEVDVFTRSDNPYLPAEMEWEDKVRIIHVPAGPPRYLPKEDMLPYMGEFSRFLETYTEGRNEPYGVVHANFFMSATAALPVCRRFNIPLVVTLHALGRVRRKHQGEADRFSDARFGLEDEVVQRADRIIAECPEDRRDLIDLYTADPDRIKMVPCGYDPEEFAPMERDKARAMLGWDPSAFYVLQLGRMVPRKGVDTVIRALSRLRFHYGINARLCIVGGNSTDASDGSTPELDRLIRLADDERVREFVEFTGRRGRAQLRRYYGACDAFATTPWYEPFGITPVEAMACARPVVGSNTGGIRYTVVDGDTGFLVPPKDPETLAARLAFLAANPALAQRMGASGALRAQLLFTWKRVALELLDVYERARRPALPSAQGTEIPDAARLIA